MPEARDLEALIDALYQAPLDRFTEERNALAASLKKAGDKPEADRVKALSKPSATAWAVNQVWWQHRDRVRALLDAGRRQRQAHVAWAQGQPAEIRDAADARQRAVADVTDAALHMLGGRKAVAPDVVYRISGTVEALASGGMAGGETPGRLTRDLQSSGLDALTALAAAAGPVARPVLVPRATPAAPTVHPADVASIGARSESDTATATPRPGSGESARERRSREAGEASVRARAAQVSEAQARSDAMASALEAAARATRDVAADEARARESLEAATARRGGLEAALDEARAAEAAARRELSTATTAVSRAEMDEARASRDAARALEALDCLRRDR